MPRRPRTPCKQNGCPNLVTYGNKYCYDHKTNHALDAKTTKAKGYNARWNKARIRYLKLNPLLTISLPTEVTKNFFGINLTGKPFVNLVMIERPRRLIDMWNIPIGFNIVDSY